MSEDLMALYTKFKSAMSIRNETPNDKILIIDGTNFFIRNWSVNDTRNENGELIGGAVGFIRSLGYLSGLIRPSKIIIVFDGKGGSKRRKDLNSNYKSGRGFANRTINGGEITLSDPRLVKENMLMQFSQLVTFLNTLPVKIISLDYIEADDVIAYLATKAFTENKVVIASGDNDYLQLINENICVYSPHLKTTFCSDNFLEKYGFNSKNFIWYKCLLGDNSDSVKGIKGVGKETIKLLNDFLNENVYIDPTDFLNNLNIYLINKLNNLDIKDKEQKKLYNKLNKINKLVNENTETIKLNFKLMQLLDVDISGNNKLIILKKADELAKYNFTEFKLVMAKYNYALNILNLDTWYRNSFSSLVLK
jgi:5'-3' exonuclease